MADDINKTPEKQESEPEFSALLDEVSSMVGGSEPLLRQPKWQPGAKASSAELLKQGAPLEEALLRGQAQLFDNIVELDMTTLFMERQQLTKDPPPENMKDPDDEPVDPVEQIALRMSLWEYEQAHLHWFLESASAYREHLKQYPDQAAKLRSDPEIQKMEKEVTRRLEEIKRLLPVVEKIYRVNKYSQFLALDAKRPAQRKRLNVDQQAELSALVATLQREVEGTDVKGTDVFKGIDFAKLSDADPEKRSKAYREAGHEIEANLRETLMSTVTFRVRGTMNDVTARTPQVLYVRTLTAQRDALIEAMKGDEKPSVKEFTQFCEVQRKLNELSLNNIVREFKNSADAQSLLSTLNAFGPTDERGLRSNPAKARELSEFYAKYVLPEKITDQFKLEELGRYQGAMDKYLGVVDNDCEVYNNWISFLENILTENKRPEGILLGTRHMVGGVPYIIPEYTLGFLRPLGLEYTKWIGQHEQYKNSKEVLQFMALEESTESVRGIFEEMKPAIGEVSTEVRSAQESLKTLNAKHPPALCKPGQLHDGETYEAIQEQYRVAIERLRDAHAAYTAKIEELYAALEKNLEFHMNRMAQNRLSNNENALDPIRGGLLSAAEIFLFTSWKYGGQKGLRGMPGVAQATGLKWVKTPTASPNLFAKFANWAGRTAVNAPIRTVNGMLRIAGLPLRAAGFGKFMPRSKWDYASSELGDKRVIVTQAAKIAKLESRIAEQDAELAKLKGESTRASAEQPRATSTSTLAESSALRIERALQNAGLQSVMDDLGDITKEIDDLIARMGSSTAGIDKFAAELASLRTQEVSLRLKAAKGLLRRWFSLSAGKSEAVMLAHNTADLGEKMRILRGAGFSVEDADLLMRAGIAGDASGTIAKARALRGGAEVAETSSGMRLRVVDAASEALELERAGTVVGREMTNAERALVGRWWNSPAFKRMVIFGGVALQGYLVWNDIKTLAEAEAFHDDAQKRIRNDLDALVQKKIFTKTGEGDAAVYSYKEKLTIRVADIGSDTGARAANWRLMVDGASLGVFVGSLAAEKITERALIPLPLSLAILGVEITAHQAINTWERDAQYAVLRETPPWLLTALGGTSGVLGVEESDLAPDSLSDVWLTAWKSLKGAEGKDRELRKRILFSWFMKTAATDPNFGSSLAMHTDPEAIQDFYEHDFERIVLPTFRDQYIVRSLRSDTAFSGIEDLSFYGFDPVETRDALASAAKIYLGHRAEAQYMEAKKMLAEMPAGAPGREMLNARVYELGLTLVFGKRLRDSDADIAKNGGKTRSELLSARFRDSLDRAAGKAQTWDAIAKGPANPSSRFRDQPMQLVESLSGTKSEVGYAMTRSRNFSVDASGIAGIDSLKDETGSVWFREYALYDTLQPTVPDVASIIPAVEVLAIESAFPDFQEHSKELGEDRGEMLSRQRDLRGQLLFIRERGTFESIVVAKGLCSEELNAKNEELRREVVEIANQERIHPHDVPNVGKRNALQEQVRTLVDQLVALQERESRSAVSLQQIAGEYFTGTEQLKRLEDEDLRKAVSRLAHESGLFLLDLRRMETRTKLFLAEREALTMITKDAGRSTSTFDGSPAADAKTIDALYAKNAKKPLVLLSGIENEDMPFLKQFLEYPARSTSGYLTSDKLFAVHLQRVGGSGGDVRYLATFAFSQNPSEPLPQNSDLSYVQIAGIRAGGSGYLEMGLPVSTVFEDMPRDKRSSFYDTIINSVDRTHEAEQKRMIENMSESERIFRAGMNPGEMRQISRTTYGLRMIEGGKTVFYLIRRDPATGKLLCKKTAIDNAANRDNEDPERWVKFFEGYRRTGTRNERELTENEKSFSLKLKSWLDDGAWSEVPADIVASYKLNDTDPAKFRAEALPEGIALNANAIEGVRDTLEGKLAVGLSPEEVTAVLDIIDRAFASLEKRSPANAAVSEAQFMNALHRELDMNVGNLVSAQPEKRLHLTLQILDSAAGLLNDGGILGEELHGARQ